VSSNEEASMTFLGIQTPYYGGKQLSNPAEGLTGTGSPPTNLPINARIGRTLYTNKTSQAVYMLTSKSPVTWTELGEGLGSFPITPYVVGPAGQAGYQTIQSAINAASTAQVATGNEQIVMIQPGTYTENLTLANGVDLIGNGSISQGANQGITISGVHTPPTSGHIVFRNLYLISATSIFSSTAAGSTHIHVIDCESGVTNGYLFNLLNWTGELELENYNPANGATSDGGINNTGGSSVSIFNAGLGFGTANNATISGSVVMESGEVNCPITFTTGSSIAINWFTFANTVTCSGSSTGVFNFCYFSTGSSTALTMNSTGAISLSNDVVNTSASPAIAGTGAGTLTLGNVIYQNNAALAGTLTVAYAVSTTLGAIAKVNGLSIITGAGSPAGTITAAQGSLYLSTNGSSGSTRAFINSNGTTGWVAVTTAS